MFPSLHPVSIARIRHPTDGVESAAEPGGQTEGEEDARTIEQTQTWGKLKHSKLFVDVTI